MVNMEIPNGLFCSIGEPSDSNTPEKRPHLIQDFFLNKWFFSYSEANRVFAKDRLLLLIQHYTAQLHVCMWVGGWFVNHNVCLQLCIGSCICKACGDDYFRNCALQKIFITISTCILGLCKSYLVKKVIPLCKVKEDTKMIEPSELTEHEQCTSIMCILTWVGGGRGGLVYSVSLLTYVVGDEHVGIWWLAQWRLIQIRDELNIYVWIKQTHKAWSKSAPAQREHVHWLLQLLDIFWFMQREPK